MPNPKAYLAVDPGSCGVICLFCPAEKLIKFADLYQADPLDVAIAVKNIIHEYDIQMVMIEQVGAVKGSAAGSTFKFGYNCGWIYGVMVANLLPIDFVRPRAWQSLLKVKQKSGVALKKEVSQIVRRLYPHAEVLGKKGGLKDGRSDALGIAHFCYMKYK